MDYLLRCSAHLIAPLLIVASVVILLSGHDGPGGGFIGGLILGLAYFYKASARHNSFSIRRPVILMVTGCLTTIMSGVVSLMLGERFLKGIWRSIELPLLGKLGISNVVVFDIGVYFSVAGVVYLVLSLAWEDYRG